jgi:hypothetical protein
MIGTRYAQIQLGRCRPCERFPPTLLAFDDVDGQIEHVFGDPSSLPADQRSSIASSGVNSLAGAKLFFFTCAVTATASRQAAW